MLVKRALLDIKEKKGIGTSAMAHMLGKKQPQYVQDRLNPKKSENISIDTLDELLMTLGYKIVLMPEYELISNEWYVIRGSQFESKDRKVIEYNAKQKEEGETDD